MKQRDQQAIAAEQDALVGLVREQPLVRGGELGGQRQRDLRGFQRIAGQRMRGAREIALEYRPERDGGRVELLGELQAARVRDRGPVGGGQRIADHAGGFDRFPLHRFVDPRLDLRRPRFGRMGGAFVDWREAEGEAQERRQ